MDYILKLNIHDAYKLFEKAIEEKEKENLYLMYLADRPYIKDDKGFNSYLKEIKEITKNRKPIKLDTRSKDDIMQELLERK